MLQSPLAGKKFSVTKSPPQASLFPTAAATYFATGHSPMNQEHLPLQQLFRGGRSLAALRHARSFTHLALVILFLLSFAAAHAQRPLGTDVSGYQTNVNWTAVKNAGVAFAWTKATEGTGYVNPYFTAQENGAQGVGIYVGAYHFARPSSNPNITGAKSADSEAAYFWSVAGNDIQYGGGYLVPMLDWEDPRVTNQLSAATMTAWVNEWCLAVSNTAAAHGVPGLRPVVYTGTWYSVPSSNYPGLTSDVTNWPNWMSDYPSNPKPQTGAPTTSPWPGWQLWQYADTNWSGGDADVFNGTLSSFVQTFVIGGTNAPILTLAPTNMFATIGSNLTFKAQASGLAPLNFQWRFNQVPIPGATSSNLTLSGVQLTNAGSYTLVVSNTYASIASSPAFLSVFGPLTNAPDSALSPSNLVNWWTADGNANDLYGTNNATPYNNFAYTNGVTGLAFQFDGVTSYLLNPGATNLPAGWTLCLWVNRQNAPGVSAALMGDTTYSLKLEQYNGSRKVGFTQVGVADYLFSPAYIAPAGVWTHLAFVSTGTGVLLYTNGVYEGATNVANFPLPRASLGADLLSGSPTDLMLGAMDEILTYQRALSAAEILHIYQAGSAGLVRAPEFTRLLTPTNSTRTGPIQLTLRGQTGKNLLLYSTTNLLNWTLLANLPNHTGAVQYVDPVTLPEKFYRALQP